ncbi:MAG: hypothetical protein IT323_02160 [Anaerolineae bacterium]|nr:hypothetical protein [Anaerolineae bacterium]
MGKAIAGVVNLLLVLVVIGLAGVLVWQGVQFVQRQSADPFGDAPKTLCQAASRRVEGDPTGGGQYRVVHRTDSSLHPLNASLPEARQAKTAADLTGVVCLEDEDTTYALEYYGQSRATIRYTCTRVQQVTHVYLIDAATRRTVRYDRFLGSAPPVCPDTATGSQNVYGGAPDAARIAAWIERSAR